MPRMPEQIPRQGRLLGFGFAQPGHPVPGFPFRALLEQLDALEALQDVPFGARGAGNSQAGML